MWNLCFLSQQFFILVTASAINLHDVSSHQPTESITNLEWWVAEIRERSSNIVITYVDEHHCHIWCLHVPDFQSHQARPPADTNSPPPAIQLALLSASLKSCPPADSNWMVLINLHKTYLFNARPRYSSLQPHGFAISRDSWYCDGGVQPTISRV